MSDRYESFREQINDANERFQAAMLQALQAFYGASAAHNAAVATVGTLLQAVSDHETELTESIEELKQMTMAQGAELRAQGIEIRALRDRLNGDSKQ